MQELTDKVALVTGGASGIGLGIARALGAAQMHVVIADVNESRLRAAHAELASEGVTCTARTLDVTDRQAFARVAEEIETAIGPVQVVCNNAGVGLLGSLREASYEDWDWVLAVNLGGVINGIQTFLPRMLARGLPGHVMATASAAGLFSGFNAGMYTASKMAVVGLMECLRGDLLGTNIGVSVLCPHLVRTRIYEHPEQRPTRYGPAAGVAAADTARMQTVVGAGMDPLEIGQRVVGAIQRDELYILTHAEIGDILRERYEALRAALPHDLPDPRRVAMEQHTLHYRVYTDALQRS